MHRALEIAEVVQMICDSTYSTHTLAVLARTCRTFHYAAIRSLWRVLPTLAPLIMCLPAGVWIRDGTNAYGGREEIVSLCMSSNMILMR